MIEPTESESKEELDLFIDAMQQIAREAEENPELILSAPHSTRISRLDETDRGEKAGAALEAQVLKPGHKTIGEQHVGISTNGAKSSRSMNS